VGYCDWGRRERRWSKETYTHIYMSPPFISLLSLMGNAATALIQKRRLLSRGAERSNLVSIIIILIIITDKQRDPLIPPWLFYLVILVIASKEQRQGDGGWEGGTPSPRDSYSTPSCAAAPRRRSHERDRVTVNLLLSLSWMRGTKS